LAISRPIVVTACMANSSESWEPYRRPHLWHSRAGGGAVHSIRSDTSHCKKESRSTVALLSFPTSGIISVVWRSLNNLPPTTRPQEEKPRAMPGPLLIAGAESSSDDLFPVYFLTLMTRSS
jgi:hypothetical protein